MAAVWRNLQHRSSAASEYIVKHGSEYYKNLLEKNKQYIAHEPTAEKCNELAKQLLYTRLASIPNRVETFWKEIDFLKMKIQQRQDLKLEEIGIAALFVGELYAWSVVGEVVGRGFTITGYKPYLFI